MSKKYHIAKLEAEFLQRSKKNPSYSIRSYARDLSLDSSTLGSIIKGKRKIPKKKIEFLGKKVCRDEFELKQFIKSATIDHVSLREIKNGHPIKRITLSEEQFSEIADIQAYTLLSLIQLDNFIYDKVAIAKKLKTSPASLEKTIKALIKSGLVEERDNTLSRTRLRTTTTDGVASKYISKHHLDSLELAKRKCLELTPNERYFSTLTFPADPESTGQIKKLIMEFEDKVDAYLKTKKKTEVFKLSIQYYQATEKNL